MPESQHYGIYPISCVLGSSHIAGAGENSRMRLAPQQLRPTWMRFFMGHATGSSLCHIPRGNGSLRRIHSRS
ncbi:hypothetical protein P7K49_002772, partial [Saguinus oedipus]